MRKCPKCGKLYSEHPALSRRDDGVEICPECGIREALEDWSLSLERDSEIIPNSNDGSSEG